MAFQSKWNESRDALLRSCVKERKSFSQAAAAINGATGSEFSRVACIGRAHRLGLTPKRKRTEPKLKARDAVATAFAKGAAQKIFAKAVGMVAPVVPFTPKADPAHHAPLLLTFEELTSISCRWPYGSAVPFKFCGCHVDFASSYCHEHTKLAHQKPTTPEERLRRQRHGEMLSRMGRKATHAARASA